MKCLWSQSLWTLKSSSTVAVDAHCLQVKGKYKIPENTNSKFNAVEDVVNNDYLQKYVETAEDKNEKYTQN